MDMKAIVILSGSKFCHLLMSAKVRVMDPRGYDHVDISGPEHGRSGSVFITLVVRIHRCVRTFVGSFPHMGRSHGPSQLHGHRKYNLCFKVRPYLGPEKGCDLRALMWAVNK